VGSKDWVAAGETTYVTQFGYDHRPGDRGDVRDGFDRVSHGTEESLNVEIELRYFDLLKLPLNYLIDVSGSQRDVERVAKLIGYPIRRSGKRCHANRARHFCRGNRRIAGLLSIRIGEIPVGLSTSGRTLLAGLMFLVATCAPEFWKYFRCRSLGVQQRGSVGLSMFTAVVGGLQFVQGFQQAGATLFLAGVIVIIVPMLFALLIGKYLFKMDPGILLGACAGARIDKSKPLYKRFRRHFRTIVFGLATSLPDQVIFTRSWITNYFGSDLGNA